MIQTTNVNGHTYYIVDARTITPRKMVAQEINLMFLIVHNSLNFNVLPIIKHLLTKIISRNSCYFTTNN